ncbi:MAG: hypothetical protein ACRECV_13820 [Xanthobacteraceae bacterium]
MAQTANVGDRAEVRSSRLWALFGFRFTRLLFPAHMVADNLGISTGNIDFWLTPWIRKDEHLPMSHLAEVMHNRGFFWDSISVESSGGANPLVIDGVPKSQSRNFVAYVRQRMNEAPPITPPQQQPRR